MSLKKRLFAIAAVAVMAATALYGSTMETSGADEQESRFSLFGKKETIYFWYADDALTDYIHSAAVTFGEREGVRVIPVLASGGEYLEEINHESLQGEHLPDAYLLSNDSLEKAYLAGLAAPISDMQNICNEEHFPKAALSAVEYKGAKIAYPMYYETSALVYNQTYLEEWAQQQAAQEQEYLLQAVPDTVDDILNIADTFDVPDGVDGVMKWDVSDIFYNYWIVGQYMIVGGDAGDDENNISINNPETIACLDVYKSLNQFFYIESDTVTYDSVLQEFIDGKTVFTIATPDAVKRLEEAKADGSFAFEYGIATMPDVSDKLQSRSMSVTGAVVVNGYSVHKELANQFAAYLTDEYIDDLYERTGRIPANRSANPDHGALQIFMEEYADSISLPKMMETGNFWLQLEVLFSKVWNGADVTGAVQELADQINLQMRK